MRACKLVFDYSYTLVLSSCCKCNCGVICKVYLEMHKLRDGVGVVSCETFNLGGVNKHKREVA